MTLNFIMWAVEELLKTYKRGMSLSTYCILKLNKNVWLFHVSVSYISLLSMLWSSSINLFLPPLYLFKPTFVTILD